MLPACRLIGHWQDASGTRSRHGRFHDIARQLVQLHRFLHAVGVDGVAVDIGADHGRVLQQPVIEPGDVPVGIGDMVGSERLVEGAVGSGGPGDV